MTGTDLCVNKPHKSRSYLNHLVLQPGDESEFGRYNRQMTGCIVDTQTDRQTETQAFISLAIQR
jgi:hypothetical protein